MKDNATIVTVPSSAIEFMQLGGMAGMTSMAMGIKQAQSDKTLEQ